MAKRGNKGGGNKGMAGVKSKTLKSQQGSGGGKLPPRTKQGGGQ